jgi:hypothetical protein
MAVVNVTQHYGDPVVMTVTNLQSLAADNATPFAGWQSALVDLKTAVKPIDVEIYVSLSISIYVHFSMMAQHGDRQIRELLHCQQVSRELRQ